VVTAAAPKAEWRSLNHRSSHVCAIRIILWRFRAAATDPETQTMVESGCKSGAD